MCVDPVTLPGNDVVRRGAQVDPPWFAAPPIDCAVTWPEDNGEGPSFTWQSSFYILKSVGGFTHAHVLKGCTCFFWEYVNLLHSNALKTLLLSVVR